MLRNFAGARAHAMHAWVVPANRPPGRVDSLADAPGAAVLRARRLRYSSLAFCSAAEMASST